MRWYSHCAQATELLEISRSSLIKRQLASGSNVQSSFVKHDVLLILGTPQVQMPVSAWQAKSCTLGLVCAGQAAHTRRSEIAARGASLHVSAFVHDSCCWSPKKVRYDAQQAAGAARRPAHLPLWTTGLRRDSPIT